MQQEGKTKLENSKQTKGGHAHAWKRDTSTLFSILSQASAVTLDGVSYYRLRFGKSPSSSVNLSLFFLILEAVLLLLLGGMEGKGGCLILGRRVYETKVSLMLLQNTGFAGRWLQNFIITWLRNLYASFAAVKIPTSKVHVQPAVPWKAMIWLSSSLFHSSDLKPNTEYTKELQDHTQYSCSSHSKLILLWQLCRSISWFQLHTTESFLTPHE